MATCMVCLEGGPPELYGGLCLCTDLVVHADCLAKLLNVPSHRMRCAVCHASYAGFVREHKTHGIATTPLRQAALPFVLVLSLCLGVLGVVYMADESNAHLSGGDYIAVTVATAIYTAVATGSFGVLVVVYRCACLVRPTTTLRYSVDLGKLKRVEVGQHMV